jgi:hypothetical protein
VQNPADLAEYHFTREDSIDCIYSSPGRPTSRLRCKKGHLGGGPPRARASAICHLLAALSAGRAAEPGVRHDRARQALLLKPSGRQHLLEQWWVATMPGIAIFIVSLGFNLLGDGLRDVLDPKQASAQPR